METPWLTTKELAAWIRVVAVLELLPTALDTQLRRDADLTHFDYYVLAMLSQAPEHTLRMTDLARQTNASLPRLSHVVKRLEARSLIRRFPCPEDGRATNAQLTEDGWSKVEATAPGHVAFVREHVLDALSADQVGQLTEITSAVLDRLDRDGALADIYRRYDGDQPTGGS